MGFISGLTGGILGQQNANQQGQQQNANQQGQLQAGQQGLGALMGQFHPVGSIVQYNGQAPQYIPPSLEWIAEHKKNLIAKFLSCDPLDREDYIRSMRVNRVAETMYQDLNLFGINHNIPIEHIRLTIEDLVEAHSADMLEKEVLGDK